MSTKENVTGPTEQRRDLVDRAKIYEHACAGCTKHGELPGECYYDEPCERLIFAFTVAEPVDAVEVVRCKDCIYAELAEDGDLYCYGPIGIDGTVGFNDFCSYGERRTANDIRQTT